MYEPGRYRGRITNYGVFRADTGNRYHHVFIDFQIIGMYDPGTGGLTACPSGKGTYYKAITEKTIGWLLSDLKAIGYDRESLRHLDPESDGAVNLFGVEIDVECRHEEYRGAQHERWSVCRTPRREKVGAATLAELDVQYAQFLKKESDSGGKSPDGRSTTRKPSNSRSTT